MITVVALSPSVDVSYVVDEFVLGSLHRPMEVHKRPGGKSLNAARAAVTMGGDVSAIAVLGGDSGRFVARELQASGVSLFEVEGAIPTRTCVSIASKADGRMTELYEPASAVSQAEWRSVLDVVRRTLHERPGWLAVSGSVPESLGVDAIADLVGLAAATGVRVAIDGHGRPLEAAVAAGPALVKVNRSEAAGLLHRHESAELPVLADAAWQLSGGIVVVTDGTAGSVATDGHEYWRVRPSGVVGGFPVGSGDSFLGGMLAALDGGMSLIDSLRLGAGCANANALVAGAADFTASAATAIADLVEIESAQIDPC